MGFCGCRVLVVFVVGVIDVGVVVVVGASVVVVVVGFVVGWVIFYLIVVVADVADGVWGYSCSGLVL